jgi:AP-3 complex subunit delta-1
MECFNNHDDSIRHQALDLITGHGIVSKKNLMEITTKLIFHMGSSENASFRDEILSKTILICSQNNYQYITNFEW